MNRGNSDLQGAPPLTKTIFISRVKKGLSQNSVKDYLNERNVNVINTEQTNHPDAKYMSFKITISQFDVYKVLRYNFWPEGVLCQRWRDRSANINYAEEY